MFRHFLTYITYTILVLTANMNLVKTLSAANGGGGALSK